MTKQELQQALVDLGKTGGEVASNLIAKGIKGKRYLAKQCPIASYLKSITGLRVDVDLHDVGLHAPNWNHYFNVALPKAVEQFVIQFDHGEYPSLIDQ
jgi:hypothetical protein